MATRLADQNEQAAARKPPPMRSMSHVENWVAVDSKESLPDEEELVSNEVKERQYDGDIMTHHGLLSIGTKTFSFA